jgi:hypothetical protein
MIGRRGLALTRVGVCVNPQCRAPLYAELMVAPDDEACADCVPHDFEGWHPMIAEAFEGEPFFDDTGSP